MQFSTCNITKRLFDIIVLKIVYNKQVLDQLIIITGEVSVLSADIKKIFIYTNLFPVSDKL